MWFPVALCICCRGQSYNLWNWLFRYCTSHLQVLPKFRSSFPPFYLIISKGLLGMKGKKRWNFFAVIIYRSLWLYISSACMQQSRSSSVSSFAVPLMFNLLQGLSCNYRRGNIPACPLGTVGHHKQEGPSSPLYHKRPSFWSFAPQQFFPRNWHIK